MDKYEKPELYLIELGEEDLIVTSTTPTSTESCNHGYSGDQCAKDGGSCLFVLP